MAVAEQWMDIAARVLREYPEEWWKVLMHAGSQDFDAVFAVVQRMTHRRVQQEALTALWLLGVATAQPKEKMDTVETMRGEVDAVLELVRFADVRDDLELRQLWIAELDRIEKYGEEEREALQTMISLLKEDQVELRSALIHHVLCLDESLMEEEGLDKDKSLLYSWERGVICRFFVLSRIHSDTESVKAVLISKYYINELYQRYWDCVVSSLA